MVVAFQPDADQERGVMYNDFAQENEYKFQNVFWLVHEEIVLSTQLSWAFEWNFVQDFSNVFFIMQCLQNKP